MDTFLEIIDNIFTQEKEKIEKEAGEKWDKISNDLASRGILRSGITLSELKKIDMTKVEQIYKKRLEIEFQVRKGPIDKLVANYICGKIRSIIETECNEAKQNLVNNAQSILTGKAFGLETEIDKMKGEFLTDAQRTIKIEQGKRKLEVEGVSKNKVLSTNREQEDTYISFLQTHFGYTKDKVSQKLKNISDTKVRGILKRDTEIAILCLKNTFWKPCVILCGGIIEGILYDKLAKYSKSDIDNAYKKKYPTQKDKELSKYVLAELINVSVELKVLEEATGKVGNGLRDYRNYIHPIHEAKQKHSISDKDANISCQFIFKLLDELYK